MIPNDTLTVCDKSIDLMEYRFKKVEMCPLQCDLWAYFFQASVDMFPTRNYARQLMLKRPEYLERVLKKNMSNISFDMIRNSFASVSINLDSMSVMEIVEEPAISYTGLLSNLGGIVGLFVASSFLTFMELVDLAIAILLIVVK